MNKYFIIPDVTDIRGDLKYLVEYADHFKFLDRKDVVEKCPLLVIEYLERNLKFQEKTYLDPDLKIADKMMTRNQRRTLFEAGFKHPPNVTIIRNTKLDGKLIAQKSSAILARRHTVGSALNETPAKTVLPVPQLVPLRSILKRPRNMSSLNVRMSMLDITNQSPISFTPRGQTSSGSNINMPGVSTSTPILAKGTTANMILNRIGEKSASFTKKLGPSIAAQRLKDEATNATGSRQHEIFGMIPFEELPFFGALRYSDSESE